MALGFGFNKTKVLSAAERYVQQGKLSNAIAEYEKVVKEDPKDLTVLNTIGDLYARVGQNDQACVYFKKVGDQYAQNGFTVKAIAIYKKLTKLSPSAADSLIKLAELYTQQGLFNDARAQYMQVADHLLKSSDNAHAARIFQKILELDPENTTTQSKLADLYLKLGKKDEARSIYFSAAESLYSRKALSAAAESLDKVLSLDPNNAGAFLLRGMIAFDSGNAKGCIGFLEKVPDLDSRPDALRVLLKARLQTGDLEGVEALANKLLSVHNDASGIGTLAQWFLANNHLERGLKLFDKHADRFLASGPAVLNETLYPVINRIRDNVPALTLMMNIMQKAGDSSHITEVMELLAHSYVQSEKFLDARELYKELAELEPENPLHNQNYRQMLSRLGEDSLARPLAPEQGAQAVMVEELEHDAPAIHQTYDAEIEKSIEAALTDAELFVSYNVASKAIAPLEDALPLAPRDARLNQRLATLYIKAERYADAARACRVLADVYQEAGHATESQKYTKAAKEYEQRSAPMPAVTQAPQKPAEQPAMAKLETPAGPKAAAPPVQEISVELPDQPADTPAPVVSSSRTKDAIPEPSPAGAHEIDLSGEWESMITGGPDPVAGKPDPLQSTPSSSIYSEIVPDAESAIADTQAIADKIQEARFYIAEGLWDSAKNAILDLTDMAPNSDEISVLVSEVSAGQARSVPKPEKKKEIEEHKPEPKRAEVKAAAPKVKKPEPEEAAVPIQAVAAEPIPEVTPLPPRAEAPPAAVEAEPDFVLDLTEAPEPKAVIETIELPPNQIVPPPVQQAKPEAPVVREKPAAKPAEPSTEDILGDFVLDLENSLPDFPGPVAVPAPSAPAAAREATPVSSHGATNGEMQDAESASVLSDILSELQDDEDAVSGTDEDPETHYNLGIAFKEMGLLDEAIGELQKVCHAVDRGSSFSQPIQAYTWLAQCLVDKGVPEAAVRWYQRALRLPELDDRSRCSIYYDLAAAYEAFGDKKSALDNFMEVYSSNIDFRDVASRIKALRS